MLPSVPALHTQPRLVQMFDHHPGAAQGVTHSIRERLHPLRHLRDQTGHRGSRNPSTTQVEKQLRQAIIGNAVMGLKIARNGRNAVAVLNRPRNPFREFAADNFTAARALAPVGPVFGDRQRRRRRQVENLSGRKAS